MCFSSLSESFHSKIVLLNNNFMSKSCLHVFKWNLYFFSLLFMLVFSTNYNMYMELYSVLFIISIFQWLSLKFRCVVLFFTFLWWWTFMLFLLFFPYFLFFVLSCVLRRYEIFILCPNISYIINVFKCKKRIF